MDDLPERLIALQLASHVGERTLAALLKGGPERVYAAFAVSADTLEREYGFRERAAREFERRRDRLLEEARLVRAALLRAGGDLLHPHDPRCPERWAAWIDQAPLVHAAGDLELLRASSLCFLASSDVGGDDLERVRALADQAASNGYTIVTGHNRAPYQAAGLAAAQHVSPVVYVLDRGLMNSPAAIDQPFAAARIHHDASQRRLMMSPFRPRDPFVGHNNRRRDALIAATAQAIVAIAVRPGGTMERMCVQALRRGQRVIALAPGGRIPETHSRLFDAGAMLIQTPEELVGHLKDAGMTPG